MAVHTELHQKKLVLMMETEKVDYAFGQTMPYWDGLAAGSWGEDECPNYYIMENMHAWCDVATRQTYAVYEQYGGFFGTGTTTVVAGGLQAEMMPSEEAQDKVSLCGYLWTEAGETYSMDNTKDIEDGINEGWCDLDDWLYEPFWGSDYKPDGTEKEKTPPGMCPVMGKLEDGTYGVVEYRPLPNLEELEKSLIQSGFTRPRYPGCPTDELEKLMETD